MSDERIVDPEPSLPDDLQHESVLNAGNALAAALQSGLAQHSDAALAQWNEAVEGLDLPEPDLGPVKANALIAAAAGGATEADLAAVEDNIDADPMPALASQVEGELADRSLDDVAQPIVEEEDLDITPAAAAKAEAEDVDLSEVVGSGREGRITVKDIEEAQTEES